MPDLQLHRPLIIFDLETTGLNIQKDRIVEICCIKVEVNGEESIIHEIINPGIPIPEEVSRIHGISDEHVKEKPSFQKLAPSLNQFIGNSDFAGFNSNKFDFPILVEEFYRSGIDFETENRKFLDAQRIYHLKEPRNLSAAYSFYCEKKLENAHSAKADTMATWEVIKAQMKKYKDLPNTIEKIHELTGQNRLVDLAGRIQKNSKNEIIFSFGKYKDKVVHEIFNKDPEYYNWMMRSDFPENTKRVITRIKLEKIL